MRVLFSTMAASGHFHPLVPLARALQDAGHGVAFACAASPSSQATYFPVVLPRFDTLV